MLGETDTHGAHISRSSLPPPAVKAPRESSRLPRQALGSLPAPTGSSAERKRPDTSLPAAVQRLAPERTATQVRIDRSAPSTAASGFPSCASSRVRYGERALKTVLDSLPPETLAVFTAGVAPNSFISFDSVCRLVEAIDAKLGRDDLHLIADCGRAVAEGTFDQMKRLSSPTPPPELLLAEMPGFVEKLIRGVRCKVRSVGRGYGRLELDEPPGTSSLTMCVLVLGFLDRSLGRFGAREVEVNLLELPLLGRRRKPLRHQLAHHLSPCCAGFGEPRRSQRRSQRLVNSARPSRSHHSRYLRCASSRSFLGSAGW